MKRLLLLTLIATCSTLLVAPSSAHSDDDLIIAKAYSDFIGKYYKDQYTQFPIEYNEIRKASSNSIANFLKRNESLILNHAKEVLNNPNATMKEKNSIKIGLHFIKNLIANFNYTDSTLNEFEKQITDLIRRVEALLQQKN